MKITSLQFTLKDQNGLIHRLEDYRGKWVLIYFYPKDSTPGCTKEACGIRDLWNDFQKYNAVVLGISGDSVSSHKKFIDKFELPFVLLSDPDREVIKQFGVLKEKKMFGKTYMGIYRESFLINPQGEIVKHYAKVKPDSHAQEVINDLEELSK